MDWFLQALIILCGCISFHGLYFLLRWKILPGKIKELSSSKSNQNHPGHAVAIVSEKVVGLYMSIVCGSSGLFILWETHEDILYTKSSVVLPAVCYIYWYFIHDIIAMYETFRLSRLNVAVHQSSLHQFLGFLKYKKLFIFHHLVFIILALPFGQGKMTNDVGYGLIGYLFIMEWSTSFISLYFILEHIGYKDTLLQQIVGILFLVIFFIVRILSLPHMYWVYAQQHFNGDLIKAISSMYWFCHGAMIGTLILQSIWFSAIVNKVLHGARKVYNKINIK